MERPYKLHAPLKTLRPGRRLIRILLVTAFSTSFILAAGLYGIKRKLEPPPPIAAEPATEPEEQVFLPAPERAGLSKAEYEPADSNGSLTLVKAGKPPKERYEQRKASARSRPQPKPRLQPITFGGSGGNFAQTRFEAAPPEEASRAEPVRRAEEDEISLNISDLKKKIKVKGAKPVSQIIAKRYSGMDREAEKLRAVKTRELEAAAAKKKQLQHEQLTLSAIIAVIGLVLILIGSRIVKALKLLHKPEGSHWTLK